VASRGAFLKPSFSAFSAFAMFALLVSCAPRRDGAPAAHAATSIPNARVRTLDSSETDLGLALRGRPALISLWATWCEPCRNELPALNRIDAWAKDHGALVVGVAVGEPLARISTFATEAHLSYMVLVDEDFRFADAIGEKRVPATLVVDRGGRIVYVGGAVDRRAVEVFHKLLEAQPPPALELDGTASSARSAPAP
jgi:peroxiredoxin